MDINIIRKPVDKKDKVRMLIHLNRTCTSVYLAERIDEIYNCEDDGDIESVNIDEFAINIKMEMNTTNILNKPILEIKISEAKLYKQELAQYIEILKQIHDQMEV